MIRVCGLWRKVKDLSIFCLLYVVYKLKNDVDSINMADSSEEKTKICSNSFRYDENKQSYKYFSFKV